MKKGLLIGINKFRSVTGLQGCVNDTLNIRSVLQSFFKYESKNIHTLTDAGATKANILGELQWLIRDVKNGDTIFFHFSSHGSQIPDLSGDEKTDRKDEILCCHDMDWDGRGYLLDDDLHNFSKQLSPSVNVEAFFDTCHSGSGISIIPRTLEGKHLFEGEKDGVHIGTPRNTSSIVGRYLEPPPEIMNLMESCTETRHIARGLLQDTTGGGHILNVNHALWSGCGEGQTSADAFIGGKYNGAFTYYWCKTLRAAQGRISRNDLLKKVRSLLVSGRYTQIPELTCVDAYASSFMI